MRSLSRRTLKKPPPNKHDPADTDLIAEGNARTAMSSAFVSKSRRARFELTLRIIDLNNVPLVSGTSFIKWHLPSSTAAEHRGKTGKCVIRDHRVAYEYEKKVAVRLTVGKDGMLTECSVEFAVQQEYSSGGRGERIHLGDVKLNLAEYVEASESPASPGAGGYSDEGVVRRYLMQDSKINSTLKLGIHMRHIEGTRDYYAPPLKTAPVFGGIAGIISSSEPASTTHGVASQANPDNPNGDIDPSTLPSFNTTSKEIGEMQDTYRRTLAAFWASQPGELKADDCIEDIFSGGTGWGKNGRPEVTDQRETRHDGNLRNTTSSRPGSGTNTPNPDSEGPGTPKRGGGGGRYHGHKGKVDTAKVRTMLGEIDEFDVRDDLRSWRIGAAYG